jgi:hypothetical protein
MTKATAKKKQTSQYATLSDQDIIEVATGIFRGEIFTDQHVRPGDSISLSMIFLPLSLMEGKDLKALQADPPGILYGKMNEAMPRSINGYPMFASIRMLSQPDAARVWDKYDAIKAAVDLATGATPPALEPVPEEITLTTIVKARTPRKRK